MKRYEVYNDRYDEHIEEESKDGDYCKWKDVEQLQALTKEFAEGIVEDNRMLHDFCEINRVYCAKCKGTETGENGIIVHKKECSVGKAQQYLDSLKESV
jgi:hypothetical protein